MRAILVNCNVQLIRCLGNLSREPMNNEQMGVAEPASMAKKRGRPKASSRRDAVVKLDGIIVGKAQMVAKSQGISLAEYLSELLRELVDRDFLQLMKKMEAGTHYGPEVDLD
jgi:hypothetical protein